ncbi:MAG: SGNH/GDSL hydrolase family protein [Burkholderiaceae bacterium]|nr:SGNH/GDSL hydrolase family protein [Burkholderiaceae bacterium]
MRQYKLAAAVAAAAILAGCGGGSSSGGNQSTKIQFSSQVSFGDSLSDVGTYAVGTVAALHGGKYTVNTLTPSAQNWTELMAASLGLPAPCPAQTGLSGMAADGFSVGVVNHAGCYGYGQGGARVTLPYGPGNANLDPSLGGSPVLGQLTVPVLTQIQNHLKAVGGKFSGNEIVFVLAGANDVFVQLATLNANATAAGTTAVNNLVGARVQADVAAGTCTPTDAQASNCVPQAEGELWQASLGSAAAVQAAVGAQVQTDVKAGTCTPTDALASNCVPQAETELVTAYLTAQGTAAGNAYAGGAGATAAVTALGQAGGELAAYVNQLILANGAKYVVVVNIPDIGTTPFGNSVGAATVGLIDTMVATFNLQVQNGLAGNPNVLLVDFNTQSHVNTQNPAQVGLTNVTTPACNLSTSVNLLGSSLTCTTANTIPGDVSHYAFADSVHPTPYGYSLLAKYVATQMATRGWL